MGAPLAVEVLENPGFFVTYAAIQIVLLLVIVRALDPFERISLGLLALMAAWGATGAAAIALIGNEAVQGMLSGDAREVFGNAISAPVVEEAGKGLALLAALVASLWLAKRTGAFRLYGVSAWLACGAAVGLGFSFTEDFFYFVNRTSAEGVTAGADLFLGRRDFFGPVALHHPVFTAAFGAGIGLATWSRNVWAKVAFPLLGLAIAVLMHAVNNGLVELILVLEHGLAEARAYVDGAPVTAGVQSTADTATAALVVLDYVWLIAFLAAVVLWQRYQRRVIGTELAAEIENGVVSEADRDGICTPLARPRLYWRLLRDGRVDRARQVRDLHSQEARLALLKWQTERFGGDRGRVVEQRRRVIAAASIAEHGGDLPIPTRGLIGRDRELQELTDLITSKGSSVVTLIGPGGVGKTRLALEVARQVEDRFAGHAYLVDLAPFTDPDRVPGAIARELGLREPGVGDQLERLAGYLRDKQLLLMLDNFEQVLSAAPAVGTLAAVAERVRILITSRVPLGLRSEQEFPVGPLQVPGDAPSPTQEQAPALQLFTERARAVAPGFAPGGADLDASVEICRRLDGLPLAIELAAARAGTLSPRAILKRIERGSELPGGAAVDLPDRQQTLESTVGWSEELLDEPSRSLFHRISVFPAGCRGDGAAAVYDEARNEDALLALLAELRTASLITQRPDFDGEPRFGMLETIRAHASARLEDGQGLADARAHAAEHMLGLTRGALALDSGVPDEPAARFDAEYENLRACLDWLTEAGRFEDAVSMALALGSLWERGHIEEIGDWLDRALAEADGLQAPTRASATRFAGRLALLRSDYARAEGLLARAEDMPGLSDRERVLCDWDAGWLDLFRGRYESAEAVFRRALALAEKLGGSALRGQSMTNLGRALAEQGKSAEAIAALERSLKLRREASDQRGVVSSLSSLGRAELLDSRTAPAGEHLAEGLALARRLGDDLRIAEALYPASLLAYASGDVDRCAQLAEERLGLCEVLGDSLGQAESLQVLAAVESDRSYPERAATLLGEAEAIQERIGSVPWPSQRERKRALREHLEGILGHDRFASLWAEGKTRTAGEATVRSEGA